MHAAQIMVTLTVRGNDARRNYFVAPIKAETKTGTDHGKTMFAVGRNYARPSES
jgi:predicted deacylase